jgi:hypothetical protein
MPRHPRARFVLVALMVANLLLLPVATLADDPPRVLHELHSVDELRALFNKEKGVPRMVLLFSPT